MDSVVKSHLPSSIKLALLRATTSLKRNIFISMVLYISTYKCYYGVKFSIRSINCLVIHDLDPAVKCYGKDMYGNCSIS